MDIRIVQQSDYLDIVYNDRNKNYGGYVLRRTYGDRMKKAGLLTLALITTVVFTGYMSTRLKPVVTPIDSRTICSMTDLKLVELPKPVVPVKPATPPPAPPPASTTRQFTVPKITNEEIKADEHLARQDELTHAIPGSANAHGDSLGTASIGGTTGGTGTLPATTTGPATIPNFVEIMPHYNGDLNAYLSSHIQYPEAARNAGIEGRVGVQFIVNEDGSISDIKITRSIGGGCDEEAMRVIASMPRWQPGRNNGRAVKVYFTQPISFRLQ
jgi:protein TonB